MMAQAQAIIRSGPGLHCVMMLMDQHISTGSGASSASNSSGGGTGGGSKWPVLKAAVGLLRNMCTSTVNLPDLLQCGKCQDCFLLSLKFLIFQKTSKFICFSYTEYVLSEIEIHLIHIVCILPYNTCHC